MTRAQEVYADTLNLLGSDVLPPDIQKIVDAEHELLTRIPAPRQPAE